MLRMVCDGTNIGRRCFHALDIPPRGVPVTADGQPIAGCTSGIHTILNACEKFNPIEVFVVFDNKGATWRHELYPQYKANHTRKELPDRDVALFADICFHMGIGLMAPEGFEADDLIASLAVRSDIPSLVVSGDKDLWQLINGDKCKVLYLGRKDYEVIDEATVRQRFGVPPNRIPDYKALVADKSDGIPGVAGIGEGTANYLFLNFDSLEEMLERASEIKSNRGKVLTLPENQKLARLFKQITTLRTDLPLDGIVGDGVIVAEPAATLLEGLGLHKVATRLRNFVEGGR